jgi:hypothetical protein
MAVSCVPRRDGQRVPVSFLPSSDVSHSLFPPFSISPFHLVHHSFELSPHSSLSLAFPLSPSLSLRPPPSVPSLPFPPPIPFSSFPPLPPPTRHDGLPPRVRVVLLRPSPHGPRSPPAIRRILPSRPAVRAVAELRVDVHCDEAGLGRLQDGLDQPATQQEAYEALAYQDKRHWRIQDARRP